MGRSQITVEEAERRKRIFSESSSLTEAAQKMGVTQTAAKQWYARRGFPSMKKKHLINDLNINNTLLKDFELLLLECEKKGYIENDGDILRLITGIHKLNRLKLGGD